MKKNAKPKKPATKVVSPSKIEVFNAATSYIAAGISLIPILDDGEKTPAFNLLPRLTCPVTGRIKRPWGGYRTQRPTLEEIEAWYRDSFWRDDYGIAILGGAISGNLEIIDCDSWEVAKAWVKLVRERAPGLLKKLVLVKTPRPGLHAYYRCETIGGNEKLARIPDAGDLEKPKTIIETKGEGGYCLAPPSPAECHKSGRCYQFMGGKDLTMVQTITPEQREVLLDCARSLNKWKEKRHRKYRRKASVTSP